jgi:molybdopterin-containing oxidoreductase family iron-sulfur binding subunit
MAQDLRDHAGSGVVMAGESQPAAVHAAVHRLNSELNNIGATIEFTTPLDADRTGSLAGIGQLADSIKNGTVKSLVIVGGNPSYGAPAELEFGKLISTVDNTIHLAVHKNETSLYCDWVYNLAHPLEVWGDGQSQDGSHCLAQPLIEPLFGGKSEIETLVSLMGDADVGGLSLVQETAKSVLATDDFATAWNRAIHDGFVAGSAAKPVSINLATVEFPANDGDWQKRWEDGPMDMVFIPSLSVHDGRFANNSWLQELPDFITKLTWENAALISPTTARKLGLKQDTKYTFEVGGKTIELPVHIQPGQALGTMAVAIGYGRTAAGRVGGDEQAGVTVAGQAVNHLRTTAAWHGISGVMSTGRNAGYRLAATQEKWNIDATGRNEIQDRMLMDDKGIRSRLIREGSFESYNAFITRHAGDAHPHASVPKNGILPVVNSSFVPVDDELAKQSGGTQAADKKHHVQWPENFHMHHELFDLTPGVRELYRQDRPELKNVWGMSIDLSKCTGCSACVIACQSENNIPVVGKEQVQRHRQMQWMRIDSYFGNNLYNKEAAESDDKMLVHQPVTCHHCENAPCETVCPVAATTHSLEGLNDMVYNRCIGTRYCGNNCPYKVRRFNYFNYSDAATFLKYPNDYKVAPADRAIQNMMMNPEVTIRSRGVMEKCTYCVQRIQNTKIKAKNEHREIGANEITTACQDVCPTQAIKFGDLNHADSEVRAAHKNPRAYVMLEELNNYPRTRYLARVRNPHPALVDWDDRHGLKHTDEKATANESKA